MRRRAALAAVLFWLTAPAAAHRLDEYLQATTISLAADHVVLRLRLTPGVDVAARVLAELRAAPDGAAPDAGRQAYAGHVQRDLSLAIDGSPAPLRLVTASFPAAGAILDGTGDIVLRFEAAMPPGGTRHVLAYANRHHADVAAYLVNVLVPADPAIRVAAQERSYDQSSFRLAFDAGPAATGAPPSALRRWLDRTAALPVLATFAGHGVRHILAGYDHLLFVAALVLGSATLWELVKVVTAFTLAHSVTLALASLDLVHVPAQVVEPLIAASIVFVAVQNLVSPGGARLRGRFVAAFAFGLVHGLGFAGGLLELMHQVPRGTVILAIVGFSVGVEAGQQMVLLPLFGAVTALRHAPGDPAVRMRMAAAVRQVGSAGISLAGAFYLWAALVADA